MTKERKIRVLVTGATGFVGRNILKAFAAQADVEIIAACRTPKKLSAEFKGEVRVGDLLDADYRKAVVKNIDVISHAGTWAALWNHKKLEQARFLEPTLDLIEQAIKSKVKRFILTSSNAITAPSNVGGASLMILLQPNT